MSIVHLLRRSGSQSVQVDTQVADHLYNSECTRFFLLYKTQTNPAAEPRRIFNMKPAEPDSGGARFCAVGFSGFSAHVPILDQLKVVECKPELPEKKNS